MTTQQQVVQSLPSHLQPFVARQDYAQYTPRDQAVWRFLLTQLQQNLSASAHPTYAKGLAKTGITIEAIPRIEEINQHLNEFGWRAVVVDGFLPPAIFMEFQAIKVLVIAVNMRSFENMLHTPAPDIVHESAGHAPFLIDIDYAEFLQRFGELGMVAIANQADVDVYEAIRALSIVKEAPTATPSKIAAAEQHLEQAQTANTQQSEAALLARLHWWTVEYGLVGNLDNYSIYGAGLLSSLGESVHCLDDKKVKKHSLTVDVIEQSYNITREQPQLFITESCRHLSQILEEYGRHMCSQRGGSSAIEEAIAAGTVNTATINSELQIAGRFSRILKDTVGNAIYINTDGSTQLAYQGQELEGHGINYHAQGFGSPIGRVRGFERCLSSYSVDELTRHHIELEKKVELNFLSGIRVKGKLIGVFRRQQKNLIFSFSNCIVTDRKDEILFDPSWGTYDMAVGDTITSVTGGAADHRTFPLYQAPSTKTVTTQHHDDATLTQFELYQKIRKLRELQEPKTISKNANKLLSAIANIEKIDWLLLYEALEFVHQNKLGQQYAIDLRKRLELIKKNAKDDDKTLIQYALERF